MIDLEQEYEKVVMTLCQTALKIFLDKAPETIRRSNELMDKSAAHWKELDDFCDNTKANPPKNLYEATMNMLKFNSIHDRLQASWEI